VFIRSPKFYYQRIMDAALRSALQTVVPPVESAPTLPPRVYVDPAVFAMEQELIFRKGWVGIGRSDRWSDVGSFAALEVGGVPIVVVRNEDGLAAFANSCRHRGAEVMQGEGVCRNMRCGFHAWTYALDGRLLGAPSMQRTEMFDKDDFSLPPIAIAERAGFVFVCLEADPPDFRNWLGDFDAFHVDWPLASLRTGRRREFDVSCNWKTFCEVFNEYYHLPYVHPDSIDATYKHPDDADKVNGQFATQFGETEGTGGLLDGEKSDVLPLMSGIGDAARAGVRYTWFYPNMVVAAGTDALWMYEAHPVSPDQTHVVQTVCFPPSSFGTDRFEEKAEKYYERFDVAVEEDIPVLESQQRGLASPFAGQGRFSYLEPSVGSFAIWYAERLLGDDS
jgi:phenylpropionate dioxygenase-like ring-hydroxylating dioxygenase large terminal subunit